MIIHRKGFLFSAGAALAAGAAPKMTRAQQFSQQFTIAVNVPLSGDRGSAGRQIADGVQAAIDETSQFAMPYSNGFTMRTFDDMDALAQHILNVRFAASDPTVVAMIGGFDGSLLAAALATYANEGMPLLVSGSTADQITAQGYRIVWQLPTKDSTEGQLHAQFVARRLHPKTAVAVAQDGDYGPQVAQSFANQGKQLGMTSDWFRFPYDKPDFKLAAQRILEKKPDYVMLCGTAESMGPLIPALQGAGYPGKLGASEGFYSRATLSSYAKAFAGGFISTSLAPLDRAPDVFNALNDFRARYPVTALSAFAYAAAQIVIAAVKTGANNRLSVMNALQRSNTYNTIVGSFQFTPLGDPVNPNLYFYTTDGNAFKYVAPAHPTAFVL